MGSQGNGQTEKIINVHTQFVTPNPCRGYIFFHFTSKREIGLNSVAQHKPAGNTPTDQLLFRCPVMSVSDCLTDEASV